MHSIIKYEIDDKKFTLLNPKENRTIIFDFPIRQLIEFHNCFIIRLEVDVDKIYNENVFGVSLEGKMLWQIEPMPHIDEQNPYTGMGREGDLIKLYSWIGINVTVIPYTGQIIEKGFSK